MESHFRTRQILSFPNKLENQILKKKNTQDLYGGNVHDDCFTWVWQHI